MSAYVSIVPRIGARFNELLSLVMSYLNNPIVIVPPDLRRPGKVARVAQALWAE